MNSTNNSPVTCIYHSKDLDGYTSGAVVKRKYPNATLIGSDYGQPLPEIADGTMVIMIDVTFPLDEMYKLGARTNLMVIDHHISFKKEVGADPPGNFVYIYENGIAACEVGWKYFFPEEPIPRAVLLLGAYDTWRKNDVYADWEEHIMPFQYGMRELCGSPETFPSDLFGAYPSETATYKAMRVVDSIIEKGEAILSYQRTQDRLNCECCAFERTVFHTGTVDRVLRQVDDNIKNSYSAICLNIGGMNSNTLASVYDPAKHDLMIGFQLNKMGTWNVSLRTDKLEIDVSLIAKAHGGGGHKAAAGFEAKTFDEIFR